MRNPLCLGSLLITLGWGAMSGRTALAGVLVGVYGLTHWPTIVAEERRLRQVFGTEYEEYCRRVPRLSPTCSSRGRFSWRRVMRPANEFVSLVGVALLAAAYGIRLWW